MYDELVTALRKYSCEKYSDGCGMCPSFKDGCAIRAIQQAADAIEDLEFACNRYEKDYKALCKYLPKWIPVTERFPEDEKDVLVRVSIGKAPIVAYDVGSYNKHAKRWFCYENDVTHWMPLPQPPKEET